VSGHRQQKIRKNTYQPSVNNKIRTKINGSVINGGIGSLRGQ